MKDEYLTANEVAERLKLNVETIYDLMKSGQLPAIKIGGRWRMEASELREWFKTLASQPPPRRPDSNEPKPKLNRDSPPRRWSFAAGLLFFWCIGCSHRYPPYRR